MSATNIVAFGSRPMIVYVRLSQCALAILVLLFVFDESITSRIWELILLFALEAYMSGMVQGELNENGLAYRRWGAWKQVPWIELSSGGIGPVGFIRVKLKAAPIWRRYLLLRNPEPPLKDRKASSPEARRFCKVMERPSGRLN